MNQTIEKYNKASRNYDRFEAPIEKLLFGKLRRLVLPSVSGQVLEVGVGTGKNLSYYSHDVDLTGIDFSPGMLEKARKQAATLGLSDLKLMEMDAQKLEFEDDFFDVTVGTFVFCTVPDPLEGLKSVYRVLKPGGKAVFIEHMKTDYGIINLLLRIMNIFSTRMLGTSMIRETQKNIKEAGFKILEVRRFVLGIVRIVIATK